MAAICTGVLALAGCSTTQETAARLQLNSYRLLATQNATIVTHASATVRATEVELITSAGVSAYVVTIHNGANHAVSDLPISVGYRRAGNHTPIYVNGSDTTSYFQDHLGLIAAHSTVTWVDTAQRLPAGARPFAVIGSQAPANISATPKTSGNDWKFSISWRSTTGRTVKLRVTNNTGVPQYGLPVYVYVQRSGRDVAAGAAAVSTLDAGAGASVPVTLVGTFDGGQLHAEVLPADVK